ncbi:unnamed protein product, partial [Ixodes hexagonus]
LFFTARNLERGTSAVAELSKMGLHPRFFQLDIDDLGSIRRFRDHLKGNYGGLDVLVNNAGLRSNCTVHYNSVYYQQSSVPRLGATNFFSTVNVCRELFPLLRPHARVVNISGGHGVLKTVRNEEWRGKIADPNLGLNELVALMKGSIMDLTDYGCTPGRAAYRLSKVGITALTFIQQRQFNAEPGKDLVVNAVRYIFVF